MSPIIATLVMTHITIICVTLYLHRGQAHRGIVFNPVVEHFMRFWLWLTTGMITKQWVAIHRQHHRHSDQPGDPHSPHVFGIVRVLFRGAGLYHAASKDTDMVNCWLWGWIGAVIWLVQMIWIPFWAAGVINGLAHWWGYRNGTTRDHSRNIVPWGIVIGGEELHNNHHLEPASARLSKKWWEFDIGWFYLTILTRLGLAKLNTQD